MGEQVHGRVRADGVEYRREVVDQLRNRLHSLPQVLRRDERHVQSTFDAYTRMAADARRGDAEAVGRHVSEFMITVGGYVCERYMAEDMTSFSAERQEML